jgi:hypothetical protein
MDDTIPDFVRHVKLLAANQYRKGLPELVPELITPGPAFVPAAPVSISLTVAASTARTVPSPTPPVVEPAALFSGAGQVHLQIAVIPMKLIKHANGVFSFYLRAHFYKGKSPRTPGIPVLNECYGSDLTCLGKKTLQILFGRGERQVPDEQLRFHSVSPWVKKSYHP